MAQRPAFDMTKLSTADKILGVAGLLFFIDTLLPWQRQCVDLGAFGGDVCASASAWGGDAGALGVLAGLLSLLLVIWIGLQVAGVAVGLNVPAATIAVGLAGLTVLFGLIKFIIVLTGEVSAGFGAYIGVVLLIALAYGAYMKWQEPKVATVPPASPPPPVGPPPVG